MNCVSCGSPTRVLIEKGVLPGRDGVYRCGGCGLDFLDHPADDEYWETPGQDAIYDDEAVARERREFFRGLVRRAEALVPRGTLLDVGAGKGEFALLAAGEGWNVSVVEPSAKATEGLAARGVRKVHNCRIEEFEPEERYDCVTVLDLLEHTRDPRATLKRLSACLRPGGALVVLTPDGGSLIRRCILAAAKAPGRLDALLKYQYYMPHLSYVSERWARSAAGSCGLVVERVERPATPRRFLVAKLRHHYRKYAGTRLLAALADCAYPLASLGLGNKLLMYMRKAAS